MRRTLTITIPGRPPTPNARRDWHVTAKDNKRWKDAAAGAADAVLDGWGDWTPITAALVTVTFVVPDRRHRDLDNLVASAKPLTDGLVASGVLADDSLRVIRGVIYRWRMEPGVSATEYHIEELLEEAA